MVAVNTLRCPSWCRTDHTKHDRFERYVDPIMDLRTHSVDVARIPNDGGNLNGEVIVDMAVTDDLNNGTREGPLVTAHNAECMTPKTATLVAAAVLDAVRIAEGQLDDHEPTTRELVTAIDHRLETYRRLLDDLAGALCEYEDAVPAAHVQLVMDRCRERLARDLPATSPNDPATWDDEYGAGWRDANTVRNRYEYLGPNIRREVQR